MAAKDELGRSGEERAARYLRELGWEVLDRNWRTSIGELDIVALDGGTLVAVEVKTRSGRGFGHPFEAITAVKRQRLYRLAWAWRQEHSALARTRDVRVDVIAITGADPDDADIEHLRSLP